MTSLSIAEIRAGAERISQCVRLDQVFLVASEFSASPELVDDKYQVTTSLRIFGERTPEGTVVVSSRHELVAHAEGSASPAHPASWSSTVDYRARFNIIDDLADVTENDYTSFAIDVATDILHPFAREHVQSMTSKSPFPAFTMGRSRSIWEKHEADIIEIGGALIENPDIV
jgi:hypothetical protein